MLGLCWDYVGVCWVVLGLCWPILGLCWAFLGSMLGHLGSVLAYLGAILGLMLGLCWVLLGRLGPMLAHLGTMLGVPGFYVGPSWLCVGLSWGYVAPSWDYVERRKDIKVQKLYENMFQASFLRYLQCFLHIARFRSASLEPTKTTKFGSRAGKTHFLQQLDSLQFSPKSKFYCNLQCFLHLLNTHLEPQNLQICAAPPHTSPFSPTGKTSKRWKRFPSSWNKASKSGKKHGSACFCCIVHLRCSKAIKQHRESIASFAECRPLGSSSSAEVSIACHEYSWVICVGQCFSILDRTNCVLSASSERTISKDFLTLHVWRETASICPTLVTDFDCLHEDSNMRCIIPPLNIMNQDGIWSHAHRGRNNQPLLWMSILFIHVDR